MTLFSRRAFWAALAAAALHAALCAVAHAQAGKGAPPTQEFTFLHVYIWGGGGVGFVFLLPIELLSIATVAFIIEHFITLHRDRLVPPQLALELETLLEEGKHKEAAQFCEASRNYVTGIVAAALARTADGPDAVKAAAATACDEENLKLVHKISWLSLFGSLGPMLGLFGTVVGMVMAFTRIAEQGDSPSPRDLAQGIFTALVTTVWGLLVAMPALGFFYVFKMRVQRLSFELGNAALAMVGRIRTAPVERK